MLDSHDKSQYVLMGSCLWRVIHVAYGDLDSSNKDGRNGVRSAVKSGGYFAMKTTPIIKFLAVRVLQHPRMPATRFAESASTTERRSRSDRGGHGRLTQVEEARGSLEGGFLEILRKIEQYEQIGFVKYQIYDDFVLILAKLDMMPLTSESSSRLL